MLGGIQDRQYAIRDTDKSKGKFSMTTQGLPSDFGTAESRQTIPVQCF